MEPIPDWQPSPKFQDRVWRHILLFALTIVTTTFVGANNYASFVTDFNVAALPQTSGVETLRAVILPGLWYSATILLILGAHELGHYFACRYYDVDASLPFFIPVPFPFTGTMGAFIKIREPIPSKRMLFDIGIAGPIAGFVIAVPALVIGLWMSHVIRLPADTSNLFELGEPLLFRFVSWALWGTQPAGYSLNMHPMAFAAWFGMLATALNLFPIGQLDGGHISYAVLGSRWSTLVTFVTVGAAVVLAFFATSWVVWTCLIVVMLLVFGPMHPRVVDEHVPLDRTRLRLALFAVVMFALCFTPAPISEMTLVIVR